ncbi:hypothetical protein [Bacillus sp. D386]|nr:hypothetical protein [Bacillus sp. D386]
MPLGEFIRTIHDVSEYWEGKQDDIITTEAEGRFKLIIVPGNT